MAAKAPNPGLKPRGPKGKWLAKSRDGAAEALAVTVGAGGDPVVPAEVPKAKERPIRPDLPPIHTRRRSMRNTIMRWAALRAADPSVTNVQIAKKLGIMPQTLYGYITLANKAGWLIFDDPYSVFEYEVVPKAISNLNELMDKKDKTATIETVKGTVFKTYLDSKGVSEAHQTVLALKIEQPDGVDVKVFAGQIVGKPKIALDTP